jgi:phage-related protein
MPNTPYWPFCAVRGASRTVELAVDQTNYGDGYVSRSTRGLNPVRPSWNLVFPFASQEELTTFDDFLNANASRGFWFTPPDMAGDVFVYADNWSYTVSDKNQSNGIVGTLQATFVRCFNPQPISPSP